MFFLAPSLSSLQLVISYKLLRGQARSKKVNQFYVSNGVEAINELRNNTSLCSIKSKTEQSHYSLQTPKICL